MTLIGLTILRCVVHVTLFSLAAAAVYFAARRIGPRGGAAALLSGLVLVLGLSLLAASPWPSWRLPSLAALQTPAPATEAAREARQRAADPSVERSATRVAPASVEETQVTFADYSAAFLDALTQPREIDTTEQPSWPKWVALVAGVGVLASAARLAYGLHGVRRLRARSQPIDDPELAALFAETRGRLGVTQPVHVRSSREVVTPATIGWRRPVVLLPPAWRDWSDAERRAIVAHELAHVAGRDYVAWLVARLAVVVHFYNPLVRWLARRLQLEQELAADAAAVDVVGDRTRYLQSLASVALATPHHRLAGPARTLIPSRSLLLRRVEMLRSPIHAVKNRLLAARLRWASVVVLGLLAVAIAGVRRPHEAFAQPQAAAEAPAEAPAEVERIPLELTPPDAIFVISAQPSEVFSHEEFGPLVETVSEVSPLKQAGLTVRDVAEVMLIAFRGGNQPRIVVRMTTPEACDKFIAMISKSPGMNAIAGADPAVWRDASEQVVRLDRSTVVIDHFATAADGAAPSLFHEPPRWADQWRARRDDHVLAVCNVPRLEIDMERLAGGLPLQMISPLLKKVDLAVAGVQLQEGLRVHAIARTDSDKDAQQVADTARAVITLAKNALDDQKLAAQNATPARREMIDQLFALAENLLTKSTVEVMGSDATLTYVDDGDGVNVAVTAAALIPALEASREAARRNQSLNNLKHLALAMHNYHDKYGHFPAARNYDYPGQQYGELQQSEHPHSWRVALLPFIDEQSLFNAYRFDEPWDSEANKKLLDKMPAVFKDPSDGGAATNASYFAPTGPKTMFPGDEGLRVSQILDGTSRTLMIVEARRDIPWTKPEDIPIDVEGELPEFGGNHPSIFLGAFADGSARPIRESVDRAVLKALITATGQEQIVAPPRELGPPPSR